ncbi:3-hydroxyacyl-ACP dehydratase FabZ family protein [Streptomyces sp. NPDC002586]
MSAVPLLPEARVLRLDDAGIEAEIPVDPTAAVFAGHYPELPLLPGVFTLHAVQQAVLRHADIRHGVHPELQEIESVRFASPVFPGDTLTVDCAITRVDGMRTVKAQCRTGRGKSATLRLRYRDPA